MAKLLQIVLMVVGSAAVVRKLHKVTCICLVFNANNICSRFSKVLLLKTSFQPLQDNALLQLNVMRTLHHARLVLIAWGP